MLSTFTFLRVGLELKCIFYFHHRFKCGLFTLLVKNSIDVKFVLLSGVRSTSWPQRPADCTKRLRATTRRTPSISLMKRGGWCSSSSFMTKFLSSFPSLTVIVEWKMKSTESRWTLYNVPVMCVCCRAEGLAAEIKDMQGQLADYNMVNSNNVVKHWKIVSTFSLCCWGMSSLSSRPWWLKIDDVNFRDSNYLIAGVTMLCLRATARLKPLYWWGCVFSFQWMR